MTAMGSNGSKCEDFDNVSTAANDTRVRRDVNHDVSQSDDPTIVAVVTVSKSDRTKISSTSTRSESNSTTEDSQVDIEMGRVWAGQIREYRGILGRTGDAEGRKGFERDDPWSHA